MFERKFEFTVHNTLEVCEERILAIQDETIHSKSLPIYSRVTASDSDSIEVELHHSTGAAKAYVTVKAVGVSTSVASGLVTVKGVWIGFVVWFIIGLIGIIWAITTLQWQPLGLVVFGGIFSAAPILKPLNERDEIITKIEEALIQQKKKRA